MAHFSSSLSFGTFSPPAIYGGNLNCLVVVVAVVTIISVVVMDLVLWNLSLAFYSCNF